MKNEQLRFLAYATALQMKGRLRGLGAIKSVPFKISDVNLRFSIHTRDSDYRCVTMALLVVVGNNKYASKHLDTIVVSKDGFTVALQRCLEELSFGCLRRAVGQSLGELKV